MQSVRLDCVDGIALMPECIIKQNLVLQNMIEEGLDIDMTPLNFPVEDAVTYINFCHMRHELNLVNDPLNDDINIHEKSFLNALENENALPERKLDKIGGILALADFLNNEEVIDICSKYFATAIEKMTSNEDIDLLRKIFNTTNDLSETEIEKIRKANIWCKYSTE